MASSQSLIIVLSTLLLSLMHLVTAEYLNVSVTATVDNVSVIQCWQMSTPLKAISEGAASISTYSLGNLSNGSYSILPSGTNFGQHVAPYPQ